MSRRTAILANGFARLLRAVIIVGFAFSSLSIAQQVDSRYNPTVLLNRPDYYTSVPGEGIAIFTVSSERNSSHMDRQAVLKMVNIANHAVTWRTTEDTSKAIFTNLAYGSYEVEASAVGYLSLHKQVNVVDSLAPVLIDIVLQRDPEATILDVTGAALPPKARKETKRAVSALKSSKLDDAQKHLSEAYKLAPASADLNFLLGYLYFQERDFAQAGTYLTSATSLNPHHTQALTLLGRTGLERQDYSMARSALERAIIADEDNWLPHNLLADAYLREKSYDKARDEATIAIAKGKASASPAQLVLGQALVGLGQDTEGIDALNSFLQQSPQDASVKQVREYIAQVQQHPSSTGGEVGLQAKASGIDELGAIPTPGLTVKPWQPASIDDVKPALAPEVACPMEKVIEESGRRAQELVSDVPRFSAIEDLFHQQLDEYGNAVRTDSRKYNYVASISEPEPGYLSVDEYRAQKLTLADYPGNIASSGFAALALVFHPHVRDNFEMVCEGLGDWRGQASWLVHFRQRDDRPNSMHSYKVGDQIYSVKLKGRAWITADKFQIVRMEAEMVRPMPEIHLLSEHQVVEYGPVPFQKTSLWLPKTAEIYFDFRKHKYYRKHSFDHYMLFSVDSSEKRKEPVTKPAEKNP